MCLEKKDSIVTKCSEIVFGELKTDQHEKTHIFRDTYFPEINVRLLENFQDLIALQVPYLDFTKIFECFANETALD